MAAGVAVAPATVAGNCDGGDCICCCPAGGNCDFDTEYGDKEASVVELHMVEVDPVSGLLPLVINGATLRGSR